MKMDLPLADRAAVPWHFLRLRKAGRGSSCGPKQDEAADAAPAREQTETDSTEEETSDALNADIVFWSSNTETSNYGQVISAAAEAFMQENPA